MTAGRRRGLCAPGPRLPGTALSVADSAVDAAAAAALRARIAAAFDKFRARVCRRRRVCTRDLAGTFLAAHLVAMIAKLRRLAGNVLTKR